MRLAWLPVFSLVLAQKLAEKLFVHHRSLPPQPEAVTVRAWAER